MKREYNLNFNGKSLGTFTLEDMNKPEFDKLHPETLVWHSELEEGWTPVTEIEELKEFIKQPKIDSTTESSKPNTPPNLSSQVEYHISIHGKSNGSFTIEELSISKIDADALVWYEGLSDWKPVEEFKELKAYIKVTPPPIPRSAKKKVIHDAGYLIIGIIGLASTHWLTKYGVIQSAYEDNGFIAAIFFFIIRLSVAVGVFGSLEDYNRNSLGWSIFAFLLPSISLICLAFVKPLSPRSSK